MLYCNTCFNKTGECFESTPPIGRREQLECPLDFIRGSNMSHVGKWAIQHCIKNATKSTCSNSKEFYVAPFGNKWENATNWGIAPTQILKSAEVNVIVCVIDVGKHETRQRDLCQHTGNGTIHGHPQGVYLVCILGLTCSLFLHAG